MNAPERLGLPDALATLSICYAPLIDKHRRAGRHATHDALGARSGLSAGGSHPAPAKRSVATIRRADPDCAARCDVRRIAARLAGAGECSARDSDDRAARSRNAAAGAARPQARHPHGAAWPARHFAATSVEPHARILTDPHRRRSTPAEGRPRTARAAPNAVRRMPFVTTGVRRVVDLDEAYERGAMASVGWPIDDTEQRPNCRLRPDQGNLMDLLRVASEAT